MKFKKFLVYINISLFVGCNALNSFILNNLNFCYSYNIENNIKIDDSIICNIQDSLSYDLMRANNQKSSIVLEPTFSEDGKYIFFGLYPQTRITDSLLISSLESIQPTNSNEWVLFNNCYYAKQSLHLTYYEFEPYGSKMYHNCEFNDGSIVEPNVNYWFRCESIKWRILDKNNGEYLLLSNDLLTSCRFSQYDYRYRCEGICEGTYYFESDLRQFLNNEFYKNALFSDTKYLVDSQIEVQSGTNDESFLINDKIFILNLKDYCNEKYGFTNERLEHEYTNKFDLNKLSFATDWAIINGAKQLNWFVMNGVKRYICEYFSRDNYHEIMVSTIQAGVTWVTSHADINVDGICVRPAITIKL